MWTRLLNKLRFLRRDDDGLDRVLDEELDFHRAMLERDGVRDGLDPAVAARDARFALRGYRRSPGFTLAAVTTLALGLGASTAVYSVVRHVLLAPLPYADPDRTVLIWSKWTGFDKTWLSDAEVIDYQTRVSAFADAAAWSWLAINVTGDGDPLRIGAALVTPNTFDVLGVTPLIGRGFTAGDAIAGDANAGTPRVVVISHGFWQRRYGEAPDVLGRTIQINGEGIEIVGVMPPGFQLPTDYVIQAEEPTQIWAPYTLNPANRGSHGLYGAARLAPGATVAEANAQLAAVTATNTREGLYPARMQFSAFAVSTTDEVLAEIRPALWLVFGAVACLLLIACANVASLQLVRADARAREMSVRRAVGAGRARLVRQLITEGLILAAVSAVLGLGIAAVAIRAFSAMSRTTLPRGGTITLDMGVLAFSCGIALLAVLLFGLAPALRAARADLVDALKDGSGGASASPGRQRLRAAFVVTEVALAVVLLTGAGLMARTLLSLYAIDLGFQPSRVLTMRLALPQTTYDTPERTTVFWDQLIAQVRAIPGVEQAGYLRLMPLATTIGDWGLAIEGRQPGADGDGSSVPADWQYASAGGPEALGERLVRGRWLTDQDIDDGLDVALVNEAMARAYWPDVDPIGRRFRMGSPERPWITVVGIVGDVRHNGITGAIKPKFYRAMAQWHRSAGGPARGTTLVIRTTSSTPYALAEPVRRAIRRLDPNLPIAAIQSGDDIVSRAVARPRLTGGLLGVFAAVALVLAAIGIYGVLSYVVSQRQREIGIRMAVGAGRSHVLGLVLSRGIALSVAGLAIGLAGALAATRLIATLLYGVTPFDMVAFGSAAGTLLLVATTACLVPAVRATRVDLVRALRAE